MKISAPENEKTLNLVLQRMSLPLKGLRLKILLKMMSLMSGKCFMGIQCGDQSLSVGDRNVLRSGDDLSDKHINFGQHLIKQQFPDIGQLKSTLIITTTNYHLPDLESQSRFLQVIHTGNH